MQQAFNIISYGFQFIFQMFTQVIPLDWLPWQICQPFEIMTFIGLIAGVVKLFAFILDCIPFF